MNKPQSIHFLGIGGSGLSGAAQIAKSQGFIVTGCDLASDTPYLDQVRQADIPVLVGHSPDHLKHIDLLAVTPAAFYQNAEHPEITTAKTQGRLITWQDFMGRYLHQDKFVIAAAGTHGKSTTAAVTGLLLEAAGMDPTVEVGATVPAWDSNIRLGQSRYFVCEADEFHDNFASFHPQISLLTLVEYDHPEYFETVDNMLAHYQRFLDRSGSVIYNADSPLVKKLKFPASSIPYHLSDFSRTDWPLGIAGTHNQLNALAVINLARLLKIPDLVTAKVLSSFHGLHRRMELLGVKNGIHVYDDYANHPSSFAAVLTALREVHPGGRLWAVIEPHTYSRLKALAGQLPASVRAADTVIVSRIFGSRESDPGDFTGEDIVASLYHPHSRYIPDFPAIASYLKSHASPGDTVVVMGSGNSYHLSREILSVL